MNHCYTCEEVVVRNVSVQPGGNAALFPSGERRLADTVKSIEVHVCVVEGVRVIDSVWVEEGRKPQLGISFLLEESVDGQAFQVRRVCEQVVHDVK